MKKIILAQVLTAKGKTEFSGLYDRHGNAVTVEVERDSSGVSLIVWQDEQKKQHFDCGISEEEILAIVRCGIIAMKMRRLYHELSL